MPVSKRGSRTAESPSLTLLAVYQQKTMRDERYRLNVDPFSAACYIAEDLTTSVAETLIRDRFVNRRRRRIHRAEAEGWGAARIDATRPLRLLDLRTTGLTRLGVSTDVTGARDHRAGRRLSQAVYDQSSADGILYRSRLTGELCCAVYDRAVGRLDAGAVIEMAALAAFVPALTALGVSLVP